ncbi:NERD domain-containing protein [Nocardia salmonicida]|uniref:NERD domain-containing protein n=1 Tax=Nocardia salmonicida TaxID=53431 RepID=UPI00366C3E52
MTSPPRPNPAAMPRHRPSPVDKPATMTWTPITESEHIHERRGLATILERLPSASPWRAWSNFEFPATGAKPFEIDLLLTTPSGLHMIELKAWSGSVDVETDHWIQTAANGRRIDHGNVLELAHFKSMLLMKQLQRAGEAAIVRTGVCFTDSRVHLNLPALNRRHVHTVDELVSRLSRPTHDARHRMPPDRVERIEEALATFALPHRPRD